MAFLLRTGAHGSIPSSQVDNRGRRKIPVPEIVMHGLEMPDPFPRVRVQRDQAIGVKIVAKAVAPIKIIGRRAGGDEDHAALLVNHHSRPGIRRDAAREVPHSAQRCHVLRQPVGSGAQVADR